MFTIDRVVGAIVKQVGRRTLCSTILTFDQVQNVLSDAKSQDLYEFLRRDRELASPTTQDQINARRNTERVVGPDENIFRIDWVSRSNLLPHQSIAQLLQLPESKTVTVQLFGKDDSKFVDSEALTGRWQAYVQSFVSVSPSFTAVSISVLCRFRTREHKGCLHGVAQNGRSSASKARLL